MGKQSFFRQAPSDTHCCRAQCRFVGIAPSLIPAPGDIDEPAKPTFKGLLASCAFALRQSLPPCSARPGLEGASSMLAPCVAEPRNGHGSRETSCMKRCDSVRLRARGTVCPCLFTSAWAHAGGRGAALVLVWLGLASSAWALDNPHNQAAVGCPACHLTRTPAPVWSTSAPDPLDPDTVSLNNRLCWSCHAQDEGVLRRVRTHSLAAMSGSSGFSQECIACHEPHVQSQARVFGSESYLVSGTITAVATDGIRAAGLAMPPGAYRDYLLVTDVARPTSTYRIRWNAGDTISVYGDLDPERVRVGDTFAVTYGKLVRATVGGTPVRLFARSGVRSLADGDATYDGICEVCHTQTAYHRNNNSGEHDHFAGQQCTLCHQHDNGFAPNASSMADCVACHNRTRGARRQVVDADADGTGAGGDFLLTSHHVYPASGTLTNNDCSTCHDTSEHGSGLIMLRDADTGTLYPFNPDQPVTAEAFCLSCHDANGADGDVSPFSDGRVLGPTGVANQEPYRAAAEVALNWSRSFGHRQQGLTCLGDGSPGSGCHASGHGSSNAALLAKPYLLPGRLGSYYTCTGAPPATPRVCTPNEADFELCFSCHASTRYPKEYVLGAKCPPAGETWSAPNYCWDHDQTPVAPPGVLAADWPPLPPPYQLPATVTGFRERSDGTTGKFYDDMFPAWTGRRVNLHLLHLNNAVHTYRGTEDGTITCVACHSVHGSSTPQGAVYDDMQWARYDSTSTPAAQGGDVFGMMAGNLERLRYYPTYCSFNCHMPAFGTYHAWTTPVGEP